MIRSMSISSQAITLQALQTFYEQTGPLYVWHIISVCLLCDRRSIAPDLSITQINSLTVV